MDNPTFIVKIDGINYELDELTGEAKVVKSEEKYTGDITIPSSVIEANVNKYKVTSIGESAFSNCEGLTSIKIPNSVTSIGEWALFGCEGLTSVIIPDSVTSIGEHAFDSCEGLTTIDIPNSVTNMETCVFHRCKGLTSVTIPDSVISIGDCAFSDCEHLTSVVIHDGVTSIGERAFSGCKGLTSVIIPDSVTSIGEKAFEGRLIRRETWVDEYGVVFSADKTILFEAPKGLKEYIIPDGTKAISQYAFSDTSETLECVLLPDSVKVIENHAFAPASGEWKKMTSIEIPDGVSIIGKEAFLNVKELKYKGKATGYPWGAKVDEHKHTNPAIGPYEYCGEMLNGVPHGQGGYYDRYSGTPLEEGYYCNGKLVDGYGYTNIGVRYSKGGDTWNGWGSGLDSEGNPYTGNWYWGHTEEEFGELWNEIN